MQSTYADPAYAASMFVVYHRRLTRYADVSTGGATLAEVSYRERVLADMLRALADIGRDRPRAALLQAGVYAAAAIRRSSDAMAIYDRDDADLEAFIGETAQGVLALYLAVSAVIRYSRLTGEPGPMMASQLDALVIDLAHMRNTVMHWDDKADADHNTMLRVTTRDIAVLAPTKADRRGYRESQLAVMSWDEYRQAADRIQRWSTMLRRGDLAATELDEEPA